MVLIHYYVHSTHKKKIKDNKKHLQTALNTQTHLLLLIQFPLVYVKRCLFTTYLQ